MYDTKSKDRILGLMPKPAYMASPATTATATVPTNLEDAQTIADMLGALIDLDLVDLTPEQRSAALGFRCRTFTAARAQLT